MARCNRHGVLAVLIGLSWSTWAFAQDADAARSVRDAQSRLRQIQADIDRLERDAKTDLNQQSDWVKAQATVESLNKAREAARADVTAAVRQSEPYIAASDKLSRAEKVLAQQSKHTASEVAAATSDAIDARLAISKLEAQALEKSVPYQDAVHRYEAAHAEMREIWDAHKKAALANNSGYQAALAKKASAAAELKAAQDSARLARQQSAAQQQAPQRSVTPRSRGMSGGSGRY